MKLADYLPSPAQISREALAVLAGVVIAAAIMSQFPSVRKWVREQLP